MLITKNPVSFTILSIYAFLLIGTDSYFSAREQLNPWLLPNYNAALADFERKHNISIGNTEYAVKVRLSTKPLDISNATITHAGLPGTTARAKGTGITIVGPDKYEIELFFPIYPPILKWVPLPPPYIEISSTPKTTTTTTTPETTTVTTETSPAEMSTVNDSKSIFLIVFLLIVIVLVFFGFVRKDVFRLVHLIK